MATLRVENPIVTLITDFGLTDEYVGVLKGVILSCNANIRLVDICHLVPPQDRTTATHLLTRSYSFFPCGSVHLVVVDPGVGTDRPILALQADGHFFVGPDNGIFTPILKNAHSLAVYRVTASELFLARMSSTFHGRDIMAPVAAQLANGLPIDRVGPRIAPEDCRLEGPHPCSEIGGVLQGEITHIDRFGNLCTNIYREDVQRFAHGKAIVVQMVEDDQLIIDSVCASYAEQTYKKIVALFDSHGYLEIAENMGSAAKRLKSAIGSTVSVLLK